MIYRTSIKRATIYRLRDEVLATGVPLFPLPVQVTVGRIGWHEHEIEEWIVNRPRAKISVSVRSELRLRPVVGGRRIR